MSCIRLKRKQNAFTLLEVMIALAVLAFAMAAIINTTGTAAANAAYLTEKTLAHWVAMNKITEMQLGNEWPSVGVKKGDYEMAGKDWRWEITVSDTEDANVRRLDVAVYGELRDKSPLINILSYIGRPQTS